ncbi:hypothetical protein NQ315_012059 [Exocentrus adspersus]|uniref:Defective in cullin neddylation protein n=1 Tax=Exocentrus adspersus TaxID=1586481 RepID=A0AAV8VXX5_9CUCU|nr:hypothetical protein NQ315_012059 [Exocentrus adspersus]
MYSKPFYEYAYDFARDKDQRSMDMETAKAMLQLLLGKHWPLYSQFSQFLEQSKYKVINKDQWCNILEFSRTIYNDLSIIDVDGACSTYHIIHTIGAVEPSQVDKPDKGASCND